MIYVLIIGCFDLLHKGHILHLIKSRYEISKKLNVPNNKIYLIASYVSQERIKVRKPKNYYYTNEEIRKKELEKTNLIQDTLIQGGTFTIPLILKKLKKEKNILINYLVLGYDQSIHSSFIELCNEIKKDKFLSNINFLVLENRDLDFISLIKPSTTLIYNKLNNIKDKNIICEIRRNINKQCLISFNNSCLLYELFNFWNWDNNIIPFLEKEFYLFVHSKKSFSYILNKYNIHNSNCFYNFNINNKRNKSI